MRRRPLVLAVALGVGAAVALGGAASASDPVGTQNISNLADQQIRAVTLSPGRVTWANSYPSKTPVTTRSVAVGSGGLALGAGQIIGYAEPKTSGNSYADTFRGLTSSAASGNRTAWATETKAAFYEGGYSDPDSIVYGGRLSQGANLARTFPGDSSPLSLSGTRVLFPASIFNIRTGGTVSAKAAAGRTIFNPGAFNEYDLRTPLALWGNFLAFAGSNGAIYRNDLSDAAGSTTLAPVVPAADGYVHGVNVFTWGDWVAWSRAIWKDGGLVAVDCGMRNARTLAPAVDLTACPTGLTSAGAVLRDKDTSVWYLQPYAGSVTPLPVPSTATEVTIDGPVLAWVRNGGVGRITPFDGPTAQPRSLGDPLAKTTYVRGGASWGFDLISSAALAHCSVAITKQGGATIRTLPCDSNRMRTGEAVVHWDGKNAGGIKVPAGSYQWVVTAADAGLEALLRPNGSAGQVAGTIAVS